MLSVLWLCLTLSAVTVQANKPHIILFVSDNLRWNDVGDQKTNNHLTPNIGALEKSGLTLENHYASPICSPRRSALMTGKYPMDTDLQQGSIPEGKLLPQHLKDLGYASHLIGKWHLGSFMKKPSDPSGVGGTLSETYDTTREIGSWKDDVHETGYEGAEDVSGKYATDVYTAEAVKRIKNHDKSKPMFLMVANTAKQSVQLNDADSQNENYAAILSELDRSVGKVLSALHEHGLLNNSIVLFSTDNGGPAASPTDNNVNNALWEGGVRGPAILWSPLIEDSARVSTQKVHNADWLPTLIRAAGGDVSTLGNIDGTDQWDAISKRQKGVHYDGNWYEPRVLEGTQNVLLDSHIGRIEEGLSRELSKKQKLELGEKSTMKLNNTQESVKRDLFITPCPFHMGDRVFANEGIVLSGW